MVTVANYIAMCLSSYGIKNVFMLSGTGSVYLDDAFANENKIEYICARHEAAAARAADGADAARPADAGGGCSAACRLA